MEAVDISSNSECTSSVARWLDAAPWTAIRLDVCSAESMSVGQ